MRCSVTFLVLCFLSLTYSNVFAVSLEAVLSSIQERHIAVEQRKEFSDYFWFGNAPESHSWDGADDYPSEGSLSSASIETTVDLLNQAVKKFDLLKSKYINIDPGILAEPQDQQRFKRAIAALTFFNEWTLPSRGKVTPENYHRVLQGLARDVTKLRVLAWPYDSERFVYDTIVSEDATPSRFSFTPETSWLTYTEGGINYLTGEPWFEVPGDVIAVRASRSEIESDGEASGEFSNVADFFHEFAMKFHVDIQGTRGVLDGKFYVLSKNYYTPATDFQIGGVSAVDDAGWKVEYHQESNGTYTRPTDAYSVGGSWVEAPRYQDPDLEAFYFQPTGMRLKPDLQTSIFYVSHYAPEVETYSTVLIYGRNNSVIVTPNFQKGLDTSAMQAALERLKKANASAASCGLLARDAGTAKLLIGIGPGMNDFSRMGALGIVQYPDGALNSYEGVNAARFPGPSLGFNFVANPLVPQGTSHEDREAESLSHWSQLEFLGPKEDFEVLYETRRSTEYREALEPWSGDLLVRKHGRATFGHHIAAWDRPRLRQVIGKDMLADVKFQLGEKNPYKYEINLYWLPESGAPAHDSDGFVPTNGLTLYKRYRVTNPTINGEGFPTDPHKMEVEELDGSAVMSLATYQGAFSDEGEVETYDLEIQEGSGGATTYKETWSRSGFGDVPAQVTVSRQCDGAALASLVCDYPGGSHPLDPLSSPTQIVQGDLITTLEYPDTENAAAWGDRWPQKITVADPLGPDRTMEWQPSGIPKKETRDDWSTDWSMESGTLKGVAKLSDSTYATHWIEWSDGASTITEYSSPKGGITSKTAAANQITTTKLYGNSADLPLGVREIKGRDGTGGTFTYTLGTDGALSVEWLAGLFGADSVSQGVKTDYGANARGFTDRQKSYDIASGLQLSGSTFSDLSSWGAPKKSTDFLTGLSETVEFNGQGKVTSHTDVLGNVTNGMSYDSLGRLSGGYSWNGISADISYPGLGVDTSLDIPGRNHSSSRKWDYLGRPESETHTAGATRSWSVSRGNETTLSGTDGLHGAFGQTFRTADGSLSSVTGTTLPFGGVSGDALSVANGLFVTKTAVADVPGTFAETHTDAWGRVHKIVTPSKSSGTTETTFDYSDPSASLKRIITNEPTGRVLITESDENGTITRSGIDVNGNGSLGASDRYTQSTTTVSGQKIVTTLSVTEDSGLREVLRSELTPANGVTVTKINPDSIGGTGAEETITSTLTYPTQVPLLYPTKTITTVSSKGWSRVEKYNNLGLPIDNDLTGTGIPATDLTPIWRADGSLASVTLNIGGEAHTAAFNPDSTLSSLIAPGRGNILGGHSISNGVEVLEVDGKRVERSLDGTEEDISGANVIAKNNKLTASSNGYQLKTTPSVGAETDVDFNAALAPTAKTYADASGESYGYSGELLTSVTLARGGALDIGYSDDGAKDLTSAVWPAVDSGAFTGSDAIPGIAHGFGYNRSGNIDTLSDPAGTRSLDYTNGRLSGTTYTAGLLQGYEIILGRDTVGRKTGTLLKRDGNTIHTTAQVSNGASDQILDLASGNITATPQRDGAGRITGYIWSDGTNTVTQTWQRGLGGRIEFAGSDVAGAPSFDYLLDPANPLESFDVFGRRLKSQTAGGAWSYVYGIGGQLTSASHPTLGTFNYNFDDIGRRTDKGTANTTDILNRTTAWTHDQNKTLTIKAHPNARVWFNGVEIQNFTGTHSEALTPPGTEGGWVPWETLAVLEDAGDGFGNPAPNPLASPDAKAEKKGAVWVPPTAETLTYDAAGNRESSAQWDFGWDAKNQLARARTKNHTTAPQAYDITFSYDSEGRRVKKHVIEYQNGAVVSEKIITFVWDGWDLLYERHQLPSGLTTLERKYLWGPDIAGGQAGGAGGLLLIRETKGTTTTEIIPLYDGTGHVVSLTDISKNLLASYAYGPFGEKISATGTHAQSNPWRYQTKYLDEETGLYYFGHRYHDPITGQFLSRDPMGEDEDPNLYRMTGGDPINHVDVKGLAKVPLHQADKSLIELALRYGLINEDAGSGTIIDTAVLNSLLTANGESPILWQGITSIPTIVCHGASSSGHIEGVSRLFSMVNGQEHSSTGNADMMSKIGAGAWGNTRAIIPEVGNLLATIGNGSANAVGEFIGVEVGSHPAFYQTPFDADGQRSAGQEQVYPGINSDNLLVGAGGALSDAVMLFAGPEALAKGFSLGARTPGWSVKLAPPINPQLASRLEVFKAWKARKGYETVTAAQFRRFMGGHRTGSTGATFYGERSGFAAWSRRLDSVHGNTAGSQAAWLYRLETSSGDFLKWGVTNDLTKRYSAGFLEGKRLLPVRQGSRSDILEIERWLTESYPGPLNLESWAGGNNLFWQNIGR